MVKFKDYEVSSYLGQSLEKNAINYRFSKKLWNFWNSRYNITEASFTKQFSKRFSTPLNKAFQTGDS